MVKAIMKKKASDGDAGSKKIRRKSYRDPPDPPLNDIDDDDMTEGRDQPDDDDGTDGRDQPERPGCQRMLFGASCGNSGRPTDGVGGAPAGAVGG